MFFLIPYIPFDVNELYKEKVEAKLNGFAPRYFVTPWKNCPHSGKPRVSGPSRFDHSKVHHSLFIACENHSMGRYMRSMFFQRSYKRQTRVNNRCQALPSVPLLWFLVLGHNPLWINFFTPRDNPVCWVHTKWKLFSSPLDNPLLNP